MAETRSKSAATNNTLAQKQHDPRAHTQTQHHQNKKAGPIDYDRSAILYKSRADIGASRAFTMVPTGRLLAALAGRVARNTGAIEHFRALPALPPALPPAGPEFSAPAGAPLTTEDLFDLAQSELLAPQSAVDVVVDTGDSLWRAPRLRLPRGAAYETQCLAGNIGAGLPTALGFSLGAAAAATAAGAPPRRTLLFQGDGGFQMTAQDAAAFARWGSNAIVILVNNDGYLIERYLSPIPRACERSKGGGRAGRGCWVRRCRP